MKKTTIALSTAALLAISTIPVASASAAGPGIKGKLCQDGTFRVVHKGDTINEVKIKKGYYKLYVGKGSSNAAPTCYQASTMLHEWLATGETTDNYLVASGTRGKKSTMFSQGQAGQFFQIKKVKKSKAMAGS